MCDVGLGACVCVGVGAVPAVQGLCDDGAGSAEGRCAVCVRPDPALPGQVPPYVLPAPYRVPVWRWMSVLLRTGVKASLMCDFPCFSLCMCMCGAVTTPKTWKMMCGGNKFELVCHLKRLEVRRYPAHCRGQRLTCGGFLTGDGYLAVVDSCRASRGMRRVSTSGCISASRSRKQCINRGSPLTSTSRSCRRKSSSEQSIGMFE